MAKKKIIPAFIQKKIDAKKKKNKIAKK